MESRDSEREGGERGRQTETKGRKKTDREHSITPPHPHAPAAAAGGGCDAVVGGAGDAGDAAVAAEAEVVRVVLEDLTLPQEKMKMKVEGVSDMQMQDGSG